LGEIIPFTPEKLVIGVLCSGPDYIQKVEKRLTEHLGPIDYLSEGIPFTFTSYYNREMGDHITRYFISFKQLTPPEQLSAHKLLTNQLEEEFINDDDPEGNRKVNLDPGLLSLGKLILASTKDNAQRIPLSDGIFAEITLIYRRKGYTSLPWTYRDYQSEAYQHILLTIRSLYKAQLKTKGYI